MRNFGLLAAVAFLAACQYYESDGGSDDYTCSNKDQKRFVRDATEYWYLWNDLLPDRTRVGDYDDPVELLDAMVSVQPLDNFSYIGSAAADAAFFGAGQYEGFGFSWDRLDGDDIRLTRVFADSPAAIGGLSRGQRIVALDGRSIAEIEAAEGIAEVFDAASLEFTMQETDGVTEFTVSLTKDIVTIDPVPQWRLIPTNGGPPVAYLELATFISTADARLDEAFAEFQANGVTDVIVDLRYNSGGLLSTTYVLGDLLGGDVAENLMFTGVRFNADRADRNDADIFFERLGNSVSLSRLVVVTTSVTASASELVINGLEPHVDVTIVGDRTFGKPVGQVGFEFCGNILRLTAFRNVNADEYGDYFDGLPVDCAAEDDFDLPVGDPDDPNILAALEYLETGACPPAPSPAFYGRPEAGRTESLRGPPWREFAGAY